MTNEEFSNEFDVLANSNSIVKPFGLTDTPLEFNEYEKSVFLTKAQETIVRALYSGNLTGKSFEETEELRKYLNTLVKTKTLEKADGYGLNTGSYIYNLDNDVMFITYETATSTDKNLCGGKAQFEVLPVTQDEFFNTYNNPFRGANERRVLRLDIANGVELISKYTIDSYTIRYISKPTPIILIDLPDGLTIDKESKETKCELNSVLHRLILEEAVNEALKSRSSTSK